MTIQQILTPGRTLMGVPATSKKKILEFIAEHISNDVPTINASELFNALIARERLGTTGLGKGIAIPHCRLKSCPEPTGLFLRMEESIDYDAIDQQSVDLLFALIVPEGDNQEHLKLLQSLAGRLHYEVTVQRLRDSNSESELYSILTDASQVAQV